MHFGIYFKMAIFANKFFANHGIYCCKFVGHWTIKLQYIYLINKLYNTMIDLKKKLQQLLFENNIDKNLLAAVLFDMDGVLVDSMHFHASSWVKAMSDFGISFTENDGYMNEGRTGHSTIDNAMLKEFNRHSTEQERDEIYRLKSDYFEACGEVKPMPFAHELLLKVQKQRKEIILVTGSGQASLLEGLNLNFPGIFKSDKMVTAHDVEHGKPHPEPYLMGIQKAGCTAAQAIVIENAPLGVESAKKAGIFTIAVNTGTLTDDVLYNCGADIVLPSVQSLCEMWDELF